MNYFLNNYFLLDLTSSDHRLLIKLLSSLCPSVFQNFRIEELITGLKLNGIRINTREGLVNT